MFNKIRTFVVYSQEKSRRQGVNFVETLHADTLEDSLDKKRLLPVLIEADNKLLSEAKYSVHEEKYQLTIAENSLILTEKNQKAEEKLVIHLSDPYHVEIDLVKKELSEWDIPNIHLYAAINVYSLDKEYHFIWSGYAAIFQLLDYFNYNNIVYCIPKKVERLLSEQLSDEELSEKIQHSEEIKLISSKQIFLPL